MVKKLSRDPLIHETCQLINTKLGEYTEIGLYNYLENAALADFSYTSQFCMVQNAEIGKFVNIAAMVRIGPTAHPMTRPTLHHFTYRKMMYDFDVEDDEEFFAWRAQQKAYIGHDTWIGHGAIIMPGVKVGNGAVIGSGAIVTKDVDPFSIVAGVPAYPLKRRFTPDIRSKLEQIKWWDWPYDIIKQRIHDFSLPVSEFVNKYDKAGD